jgi:hypothetical protein
MPPWSQKTDKKLGSPVHLQEEPEQLPGPKDPASCKEGLGRRKPLEPQGPYIGIDVAKDRLDVAARPGADIWSVSNDPDGITELVHQLTERQPQLIVLDGRAPAAGGCCSGCSRAAPSDGQPPPGPGLCQSHRQLGQDRPTGCPGSGPLCRGGVTHSPPAAGCPDSGTDGPPDPAAPGHRDAHCREKPAADYSC